MPSPTTMRAYLLEAPGPPESLRIVERAVPVPADGQVLIHVEAFGLNRSDLYLRKGLAEGVALPRVPGLECAGVVVAAPGTDLQPGERVLAMAGGMGRTRDGSYAQYVVAPAENVVAVDTDLDWATLGALPGMLQTAHGTLTTGLLLEAGQTVLIRGGTSSIGMACTALAKHFGATVLATTRRPERAGALEAAGADHVVIDTGEIAAEVRRIVPGGVDAAVELVGAPTLPDTLRATRMHGVVCFTGMLSEEWTLPGFYPIETIPTGVRLTAYGIETPDIAGPVLDGYLDAIAEGRLTIPIHAVYPFADVAPAHRAMEENRAIGKLVVRVDHPK